MYNKDVKSFIIEEIKSKNTKWFLYESDFSTYESKYFIIRLYKKGKIQIRIRSEYHDVTSFGISKIRMLLLIFFYIRPKIKKMLSKQIASEWKLLLSENKDLERSNKLDKILNK